MALKDEPSPKCAFLTATAALGVTAAAATAWSLLQLPAAKHHGPAVGTSLHKKLAAGAESIIVLQFY